MSQPDILVWLDPGLTTGIAWFNGERFDSCQLIFQDVGVWLTSHLLGLRERAHVGWEHYVVTGGGGRFGTPAPSLETIGMTRWICHEHGATILPAQPSSARKLGGDDKLKRLRWYKPGKRHANDAANHLLSYLLRTHSLPPELAGRLFTSG